MGWAAEELLFNSRQGQHIFLISKAFRLALGPIQLFSSFRVIFHREKSRRRFEFDHLYHYSPYIAEIKNVWCSSNLSYVCLVCMSTTVILL